MLASWLRAAALWIVLAIALSGLGCSENDLGPFQPEITSATDNFQLQATGVRDRTGIHSYDWQNSGSRAKINHSTSTTRGEARLTVRDAVGTVVYDEVLVPSLSDTTSSGVAGTWRVQLTMTSYSGALNFRVQKL